MLKEKAKYYYGDMGMNCAQGILKAAGDVYDLQLSDAEVDLFRGFGKGYGCGITCGALSACTGVLSRMYPDKSKDEMHEICSQMVKAFSERLGDTLCAPLEAKNKTPENRCLKTVEECADVLEEYINRLEGNAKPAEPAEGCTLIEADIKRVKALGFLNHKGTNKFNGRIITRNGRITNEEMKTIYEAADLYGDGYVMLTTRLTVEVSGIDYNDIDSFIAYVNKAGLITGGTGSKVRPVVACKAATCQYGLYDAYALSEKIHERFYLGYNDINLPHKFKIALGGCPNNCVKPNLNDLGVVGARIPIFEADLCMGCKKCRVEEACPIKIAHVGEDKKLFIDPEKCNNCGRCVGKCPFKCIEDGTYGWKIYIGGRWGKKYIHGRMLPEIFTNETEVLDTIEKTILFFREEGKSGERLGETINRIGFEACAEKILSDDLLIRKNEILGLNVTGGASC